MGKPGHADPGPCWATESPAGHMKHLGMLVLLGAHMGARYPFTVGRFIATL